MEDKLEPQKTPDVVFPIEGATSCPHCKSTKKLGKAAFDQLMKDGKIPVSGDWGLKLAVPITRGTAGALDPTPVMLMMGLEFEVCGNCYTMYMTKIDPKAIPLPPGMPGVIPPKMHRG